eukprot:IDg7855t1
MSKRGLDIAFNYFELFATDAIVPTTVQMGFELCLSSKLNIAILAELFTVSCLSRNTPVDGLFFVFKRRETIVANEFLPCNERLLRQVGVSVDASARKVQDNR